MVLILRVGFVKKYWLIYIELCEITELIASFTSFFPEVIGVIYFRFLDQ